MQSIITSDKVTAAAPLIRSAWRESCLAGLSRGAADRLLKASQLRELAAGCVFERAGATADAPSPAIVVEGLLRIYRRAPDGREVTVRYVAPGGIVGLSAVLGTNTVSDRAAAPGWI